MLQKPKVPNRCLMSEQKILNSNVKGANKDSNRSNICSLAREHRPTILCKQETKSQEWTSWAIRSLGMGNNVRWAESRAVGLLGGILTV